MKRSRAFLALTLLSLLVLAGCGYYFPHVYEGPEQVVYMPNWENRTNKLGLDSRIYQSLSRWFQKSDAVKLTKERAGANYILAGEIVAIDLPSVSWDGVTRACCIYDTVKKRIILFCTGTREGADLMKELRTVLPPFMIPGSIHPLEEMPLNKNGKIDRKQLAEIYQSGQKPHHGV